MCSTVYGPNDDILIEKTPPKGIYFIQSGKVEIIDKKSKATIKYLSKGEYFGEIGLFTRAPCCSSVVSFEYSDLSFLKIEDFDTVLHTFPSALKLYQEINVLTESGDLEVLGVICYLCKTPGHVANKCTLIQLIRDQAKNIWLASKVESRFVNPIKRIPKYHRRKKIPNPSEYCMQKIKGIKSTPKQLFKKKKNLINTANRYINTFKNIDKKRDSAEIEQEFLRIDIKDRRKRGISSVVDSDEDYRQEIYEIDLLGYN